MATKKTEDTVVEEVVEPAVVDEKVYTLKKGACIRFKAGIKQHGDVIDFTWPEYAANKDLKAEQIKVGLLVEVVAEKAEEAKK